MPIEKNTATLDAADKIREITDTEKKKAPDAAAVDAFTAQMKDKLALLAKTVDDPEAKTDADYKAPQLLNALQARIDEELSALQRTIDALDASRSADIAALNTAFLGKLDAVTAGMSARIAAEKQSAFFDVNVTSAGMDRIMQQMDYLGKTGNKAVEGYAKQYIEAGQDPKLALTNGIKEAVVRGEVGSADAFALVSRFNAEARAKGKGAGSLLDLNLADMQRYEVRGTAERAAQESAFDGAITGGSAPEGNQLRFTTNVLEDVAHAMVVSPVEAMVDVAATRMDAGVRINKSMGGFEGVVDKAPDGVEVIRGGQYHLETYEITPPATPGHLKKFDQRPIIDFNTYDDEGNVVGERKPSRMLQAGETVYLAGADGRIRKYTAGAKLSEARAYADADMLKYRGTTVRETEQLKLDEAVFAAVTAVLPIPFAGEIVQGLKVGGKWAFDKLGGYWLKKITEEAARIGTPAAKEAAEQAARMVANEGEEAVGRMVAQQADTALTRVESGAVARTEGAAAARVESAATARTEGAASARVESEVVEAAAEAAPRLRSASQLSTNEIGQLRELAVARQKLMEAQAAGKDRLAAVLQQQVEKRAEDLRRAGVDVEIALQQVTTHQETIVMQAANDAAVVTESRLTGSGTRVETTMVRPSEPVVVRPVDGPVSTGRVEALPHAANDNVPVMLVRTEGEAAVARVESGAVARTEGTAVARVEGAATTPDAPVPARVGEPRVPARVEEPLPPARIEEPGVPAVRPEPEVPVRVEAPVRPEPVRIEGPAPRLSVAPAALVGVPALGAVMAASEVRPAEAAPPTSSFIEKWDRTVDFKQADYARLGEKAGVLALAGKSVKEIAALSPEDKTLLEQSVRAQMEGKNLSVRTLDGGSSGSLIVRTESGSDTGKKFPKNAQLQYAGESFIDASGQVIVKVTDGKTEGYVNGAYLNVV